MVLEGTVCTTNREVESHNMIIWMWVPLAKDSSDVAMIDELTCCTSSTGSSEMKEGAPSSLEAARPILLAAGKEDKDERKTKTCSTS